MSLSKRLGNANRTQMGDDQGRWRQFILDHLDFIARRSQTKEIPAEMMNLYRYDLDRFLKQECSRNEDIAWIVLLINDLPSDFEFVGVRFLIVPTDDLISSLFHSFSSLNRRSS
jgi:hypothetical protein